MSLLSLSDVDISFGARDIIEGVSCEANAGERIGLVGRNGAGKTTLLRVLAGIEPPTSGQRHAARHLRFALVEQIPPLDDGGGNVRDEVLSAVQDLIALTGALHAAADAMTGGDADAADYYAHLLQRMEAEGGYAYEARFAQVMSGLGFSPDDWDKPLSVLSGGQRSRVGLARALMAEPDLLLMDEPTNHLDIQGLRWLEGFLTQWQGSVIVTSHDRTFLDKIATRIWHIDSRSLKAYPGNYSKSEELRTAEATRQEQEFVRQQEMIAREEAFIRRFGAGTRAAQAQSRAKKLARLERIEAPKTEPRSARFRLKASRSGELVLRTEKLVAGYDAPVLRAGNLELERGVRVALVGRNGSGKTTLLKTIAGEIDAVEGALQLGTGVQVAHYWQEAEGLDQGLTVIEELQRDDPDPQAVRDLAGRFLFSGDDVLKRVGVLSGGERSRLALAKLVRSSANLVLLDEPTNHLDIPSREALEQALDAFEGTLVFASHDRRLIGRLATRLWLVEDGRLTQYEGSLEAYERQAESVRPRAAPKPARTENAAPRLSGYRRAEALATLEAEIEARESEQASVEHEINRASDAGEALRIGELGRRFEALKAEIERLLEEWAGLSVEV